MERKAKGREIQIVIESFFHAKIRNDILVFNYPENTENVLTLCYLSMAQFLSGNHIRMI